MSFTESVAERRSLLITPDLSKCAVFRNLKPKDPPNHPEHMQYFILWPLISVVMDVLTNDAVNVLYLG